MSQKRIRGLVVTVVALLAAVSLAALAGAQESPQVPGLAPIATGLSNPRHLAFGADGALYVAEAGSGGNQCTPVGEGQLCVGETGAITRIEGGLQDRITTDLVSWANEEGEEATGPHDVAWDAQGNLMVIVGLGNDPNNRADTGPFGALGVNFGQLVQIAADGSWTNVIDVAAYEATANPDGGALDSNPYALERVDDGFLVADAGANALLHVADSGDITTVAVFPNRMVEFPPGSGNMMPMQAVPTSVAVGPDGAYYVGQLTGFPFPVGGANVYRVVPSEEPEVFADGFTNVVDITFDDDGNLYVVEIAANGLLSGDPTGALIRVDDEGNQTVLASKGLFMPGGVAVGDDGLIYVTTGAAVPDIGTVVRIPARPTVYLPIIVPPGTP